MLVLLLLLMALLQAANCVDIITTVAGTGTASFSGDNGAATSATLNNPMGVTLDSSGILSAHHPNLLALIISLLLGNIYIADTINNRVRKVTASTGIITTIVGTGSASYSGDNGQASSAALKYPHGLTLDSIGTSIRYYFFSFTYWFTR